MFDTLSRGAAHFPAEAFHLGRAMQLTFDHANATARAHFDSARVILEERVRHSPEDHIFHTNLALAYAGLGRKADAIREAGRSTELMPLSKDALAGLAPRRSLVEVELMLGDFDAAVGELAHLMSVPSGLSVWYLKLNPLFDQLRKNPRFQQLVAKP